MRKVLTIILLCFSLVSLAQDVRFATIQEDEFEILVDTNYYKNEIREIIFGVEDSLHFYDKISVVKDVTFGQNKEVYFFVLL